MLLPMPITKNKIITLVEFIRNFLMKINLAKGNIGMCDYFFTDNVDVSSNVSLTSRSIRLWNICTFLRRMVSR